MYARLVVITLTLRSLARMRMLGRGSPSDSVPEIIMERICDEICS